MRNIAILTSGGDAPGMNAAVRAVVRTAIYHDLNVYGVIRGYSGLIDNDVKILGKRDVANIIHRGGTILKTSRSEEFRTPEGRKIAADNLKKLNIEGLIVIGGNGSLTGAKKLSEEHGIAVIGIPGTIDNDLYGTDLTIGFDTAVNTAMEAVDRIRDTADSHDRVFFIEVMGRKAGFIALQTGISSGATSIMIPERKLTLENLVESIRKNAQRNKLFNLVIVAEGNPNGSANTIEDIIKRNIPELDTRVTIIGHLQRGGAPTAVDRLLSSRLGYNAVIGLMKGENQVMVGIKNNHSVYVPFEDAITKHKEISDELIEMANIIST